MPLGYDVKEEATEVKKNLFENRDSFIMLVVAGVVGGIITRAVIPKSVTEGSILNRIKSLFGYDEEED
jgi:hypothetical protein|tara:strand:+ start:1173 stop:1376 length:204 start_codon:yes stop_codon:yes gene_type:complete